MKFQPILGSQLSGSIGGVTATKGRNGVTFFRQRNMVQNPQTQAQSDARSALAQQRLAWGELSQEQRDAWQALAQMTAGNPAPFNLFCRLNSPRAYLGLPGVADPPATAVASTENLVIVSATEGNGYVVGFEGITGADWAAEDGAALYVRCGRPVSPTRFRYSGPWQIGSPVLGDNGSPVTDSATVTAPFLGAEDQMVDLHARITRADGSLSEIVSAFLPLGG